MDAHAGYLGGWAFALPVGSYLAWGACLLCLGGVFIGVVEKYKIIKIKRRNMSIMDIILAVPVSLAIFVSTAIAWPTQLAQEPAVEVVAVEATPTPTPLATVEPETVYVAEPNAPKTVDCNVGRYIPGGPNFGVITVDECKENLIPLAEKYAPDYVDEIEAWDGDVSGLEQYVR